MALCGAGPAERGQAVMLPMAAILPGLANYGLWARPVDGITAGGRYWGVAKW